MARELKNLDRIIKICSLIMWLPQALAMIYISLQPQNSWGSTLICTAWSAILISSTYFAATQTGSSGDWLMLISIGIGILTEVANFGLTGEAPTTDAPRVVWLIASAAHGLFAGILCKAKDLQELRFFAGYSIAERLYMVVPFTLGQWIGYVLAHGWSGIITVMSTIMLCLSTVGYGVFTFKIMRYFGITSDIMLNVEKLFTSSFGVVFTVVVLFGGFVIFLAVPFLDTLLSLNALISGVGIVMEFIIYDVIGE